MTDSQATVTIIILNWNGLGDTLECMESLGHQTFKKFRVLLVDNGSDAHEVERLKTQFGDHPRVTLILNDENLGFTAGNNVALDQCLSSPGHQKYIVLLNNDTVVERDWLGHLVETAEQEHADMVSSKMINYYTRNRMDNAGHKILNTLEVLPIGHDEPVNKYRSAMRHVGPCGGAGLYSIAMLRDIGSFDPHFTTGYEDVELGLRGVLCGYSSVFSPDAVVYHKISRSVNRIRDFNYTLGIQRNIYYIITKLMPPRVLVLCLPFLLIRFIVACFINLLALRFRYLRIQVAALYYAFFVDLKSNMKSRKAFFHAQPGVRSRYLLRHMEWFFREDFRRFIKYIVRREKMVFERYN